MDWLSLGRLGLLTNLAAFAVGAAVVWIAGDRLTRYGDIIADRTSPCLGSWCHCRN